MEMSKENILPEEVKEEKQEAKQEGSLQVSPALKKQVIDIIQEGIKTEQDSAQIYEAMSAVANSLCYSNTSKWFKIHATEEREHSDWVIKFLSDKNITPILPEISKPDADWKTIEDILASAYKHEESVTNFWNRAATECLKYADHDAYQFCLYVLKEQREEIELFSGLISLYNLSKDPLVFDSKMIHP